MAKGKTASDKFMELLAKHDNDKRDRAAREMFAALRAIKRITDGSQPKDCAGAAMVAEYAINLAIDAGIALECQR